MRHGTVQTKDMKQQVQFLQNENNRLRMESEFLIATCEINDNTENFIALKNR